MAGKNPEKNSLQEQEAEYTVQELAGAAETLFNTKPECVIAALRLAGIEKATKQVAERIVTKFLTKEVK